MKIQSRLDNFFIPKFMQKSIQECRIIPNTFSDHSALILTICFNEETAPCGPGYWRFNNLLKSTKRSKAKVCFGKWSRWRSEV